MVLSDIASRIISYEFHIHAQIISKFGEALAKPGRGNVFVAHAAANRGQRGRCPSRICRVLQVPLVFEDEGPEDCFEWIG